MVVSCFDYKKEIFNLYQKEIKNETSLCDPTFESYLKSLDEYLHKTQTKILSYQTDLLRHPIAETYNPPKILFVQGNSSLLFSPSLGVVGTRKANLYGLAKAFQFGFEISKGGFVVSSGLALGVDAASHKGALKAHGKTIAFLGGGFKHLYPKENIPLAHQILEQGGALVSEYLPDSGVRKFNFPQRNRLIAGFSDGVLVVQAAEKSGSLITAQLALEENKMVYVVPPYGDSESFRGNINLINQGALMVSSFDDLLENYIFTSHRIEFIKHVLMEWQRYKHERGITSTQTAYKSLSRIFQTSQTKILTLSEMLDTKNMSGQYLFELITWGREHNLLHELEPQMYCLLH